MAVLTGVEIDTEVREITPEEAQDLLDRNIHNRKLKPTRVQQLAGAMTRGEWEFNGDAIRVSDEGNLLDGQHRLAAVIESGIPQRFLLITGLPVSAQETMDMGAKRNVADLLRLRGEVDVNRLAAVARLVYNYETRGTFRNSHGEQATAQQVLAVVDRHPGIREAVARTRPVIANTTLMGAPAGACYYLFSLVDPVDTEVFFTRLALGSELGDRNPIFALRRRFLEVHGNMRILPHVQGALTIKAWNAWRVGNEMSIVTFSPTKGEKFPQVEGLELP